MSYEPQFTVTPALLSRVEAIAALRERILRAAVQLAWIPALQKDARVRNAHSSTAIEGNPLTLEDVRAVEQGAPLSVPERARREGVNYFAALRHIEQHNADYIRRLAGRHEPGPAAATAAAGPGHLVDAGVFVAKSTMIFATPRGWAPCWPELSDCWAWCWRRLAFTEWCPTR